MFPALLLIGTGCSGINTSQSISPASFFLPGLLKADPPVSAPGATISAGQLAQIN